VTGFFAQILEAFERQKEQAGRVKMARMGQQGIEGEWGVEDMT
jgi:hypothetical protein